MKSRWHLTLGPRRSSALATFFVAVCTTGCSAPHEPAAVAEPQASSASPVTSSGPSPANTAVASAPTTAPVSSSAPSAAPETSPRVPTVGDVTCAADADCAITARRDCCDCCATQPAATSAAWLKWFEGTQCATTRCEPCGKVKCPDVDEPGDFRPVCVSKRCSYVMR